MRVQHGSVTGSCSMKLWISSAEKNLRQILEHETHDDDDNDGLKDGHDDDEDDEEDDYDGVDNHDGNEDENTGDDGCKFF